MYINIDFIRYIKSLGDVFICYFFMKTSVFVAEIFFYKKSHLPVVYSYDDTR